MMKAPVCIKCQTSMRVVKAGVTVIEMFRDPPVPYKLWPADVRECPKCGLQITCGYPDRAILQHFEDDFQEYLDRIPEQDRVYDYERYGGKDAQMNVMDQIKATQERNRKELEALATMTGQTVAQVEADVCAPDPGDDEDELMAEADEQRREDLEDWEIERLRGLR